MSSRDYIYIIELLYELMKIIHIKHLGFPGGSVVKNLPATAEAKDIKKRWQEYTEDLCSKENTKDLNDPDNHNSVITHLEPNILECKVKWALGSITMNKAWR